GPRAPRRALLFFAVVGSTPLAVSLVMFFISATQLGSFCKTCVGIYVSSAILAAGAWLAWARRGDIAGSRGRDYAEPLYAHRSPHEAPPRSAGPRSEGGAAWLVVWPVLLGIATLVPPLVYVTMVPDELAFLKGCGKLEKTVEAHAALIKMKTSRSVRP